jgi:AraC-like DNA-binding protein
MVGVRVSALEELSRDPRGRYFAGEGFAHFCHDPSLWGVILWGRVTAAATARLVTSLAAQLNERVAPHVTIVDVRRVEIVEPQAFELLGKHVVDHQAKLARQVSKLAVVRGQGMPGALAVGFFDVFPSPQPVEVFVDLDAACRWLAVEDADGVRSLVESVHAETTGAPPFLVALRAAIRCDLVDVNIDAVSSRLGMSQRTLQRRLLQHGTSFTAELEALRLEAAKNRLIDSEDAVTHIALDVGFATIQHFSTRFRRTNGLSPSAWRDEKRRQRQPWGNGAREGSLLGLRAPRMNA